MYLDEKITEIDVQDTRGNESESNHIKKQIRCYPLGVASYCVDFFVLFCSLNCSFPFISNFRISTKLKFSAFIERKFFLFLNYVFPFWNLKLPVDSWTGIVLLTHSSCSTDMFEWLKLIAVLFAKCLCASFPLIKLECW